MNKRYYEDYEIGFKVFSETYEVEKTEVIEFAKKWDPQPFHIDEEVAKLSIFGGLTASSVHTIAVASYLVNTIKPKPAVLALLGVTDMEFPNPMRPGDKIILSSTVIEKRELKTRPDRGIIHSAIRVANQNDEPVATYILKHMVSRRPGSNKLK